MGWYLRQTFQDERFRLSVLVGAGALLVIIGAFALGIPWLIKLSYFVLFPILALSVSGSFVVFGMVFYEDYSSRKTLMKRSEGPASKT